MYIQSLSQWWQSTKIIFTLISILKDKDEHKLSETISRVSIFNLIKFLILCVHCKKNEE